MSGGKLGRAITVFKNVDSDKFSDEEKALAIYDVLNMPTRNSVPKEAAFKVIDYLWNMLFEMEREDENGV